MADKTFSIAVFDNEQDALKHQAEMAKQRFDVALFGPVPDVVLRAGDEILFDTGGAGKRWVVTSHNQS